ncbi:hypothetical protein HN014_22265 (plasmid) [Aquimarina sp. TRL1]|uniref:hypothetical protein n=1 Tax=Aquimarina sp. (strain TRL1) TaxID=2736252 RepID=UPI001589517A|nr:hypothetical protein [Aquimarina sp. TRL1]QKX07727.1 hypothetical protein HN014_22265 [Aquimarina sp. TRL1]
MGWTSFHYTDSTHQDFNAKKAYDFCMNEFDNPMCTIVKFWFQKAESKFDRHTVYLVINHINEYNFIMVVSITIDNNHIFYKETTSSMGPVKDKCPVEFLSMVPLPENPSYEYDWFIKVKKNNIRYKNQIN